MPFAVLLDTPIVGLVGADARRFCNSMFTNNARDLPIGQAQRTAMLDDRGRLQGLMSLFCVDADRFWCALDGPDAEAFGDRYALYVVLDDVEIEPMADHGVVTVQGQSVQAPAGCAVIGRDRSGLGGVDVVGPLAVLEPWLGALGLPEVDAATLERLRVRVGEPRWPHDFGDKRLAHEMGMRPDYLHFEKGCYVGQETVNRVDVMGQVKRQLAGVVVDSAVPVGAQVMLEGKPMGTITSVADDPELGRIGLAVLKKPADAAGTAVHLSWDGTSAAGTVSGLPFTV